MTILSGTLSSKNSRYVFGPRKVQVYTSPNQYQKKSIRRAILLNTAVRFIPKLKYDNPSNILRHEAFNKLKLLTVTSRFFELNEIYLEGGLLHSLLFVIKLVDEYKAGNESRYVEYPNPLCNSQQPSTLTTKKDFVELTH
ncbi:hypothetical protein BpHYR1_020299 [Brachionus plicatilis]|uniref:Uncharacterized protein n=1 Tax=Brachionus plicatilis TaxID=10195 RepID=A0A3M7RCH2_BRAPC|nr:hypothetical protein BpHYR1_020299 [Brachionus plicatilis]